jgi:tRNA threonylcarbamoyladenosine biosynthesis protein TsaB
MTQLVTPRLLILETSGRSGWVAVAQGEDLCAVRRLEASRRHARDLAPAVANLLAGQGWCPRDLQAVLVGRGPGSYTGLRVGVMSAKALAYATGCSLVAVDTFAVIAHQTPPEAGRVEVLADAQQDKVYVQPFAVTEQGWRPLAPLAVRPFADWLAAKEPGEWVTGPGLEKWEVQLPAGTPVVPRDGWEPQPQRLLHLGLALYHNGKRDDPFALEPLYLRPSSAEEQWRGGRP